MRKYALLCFIGCCMFVFSKAVQGKGIEAAASAERVIESCQEKSSIYAAACVNNKLNGQWGPKYIGKTFYAIGRFEGVKQSVLGNVFAFVVVDQYRVSCKITKTHTESLGNIAGGRAVLIQGVVDSYRLRFNLQRLHHLRLVPYCLLEAAI